MELKDILRVAEMNEKNSKNMAEENNIPCLEELHAFYEGQAKAYGHIVNYITQAYKKGEI